MATADSDDEVYSDLHPNLPAELARWPRSCWPAPLYPNFAPGDVALKCEYSARKASERWQDVLEAGYYDGGLLELGVVDFALGVFDLALQINVHFRRFFNNRLILCFSTKEWLEQSDSYIAFSHALAYNQVEAVFPNHDLLSTFSLDAIRPFVRHALTSTWEHSPIASTSRPSCLSQFDTDTYTDRYIPEPSSLPPRKFIKGDPDNKYPDVPAEVWLDWQYKQVDPPDGASAPNSVQAPAHAEAAEHDHPPPRREHLTSESESTATSAESSGTTTSTPEKL